MNKTVVKEKFIDGKGLWHYVRHNSVLPSLCRASQWTDSAGGETRVGEGKTCRDSQPEPHPTSSLATSPSLLTTDLLQSSLTSKRVDKKKWI
ncbi:unnamed protein product [Camellia sinensis]